MSLTFNACEHRGLASVQADARPGDRPDITEPGGSGLRSKVQQVTTLWLELVGLGGLCEPKRLPGACAWPQKTKCPHRCCISPIHNRDYKRNLYMDPLDLVCMI